MAERSKRIIMKVDKDKICSETLKLLRKYEGDMTIRELSPKTIYNYKTDLFAWFSYVYEFQSNECIKELDEDDITEFILYCKTEGNNSRRIKRRMSSISAFYKYLRKKRIVNENPMDYIDRGRKDTDVVTQTFLSQEQVDLMRQYLKNYGDLQLETYINLSLSTMARVNAISSITWKQIDLDNRMINDVIEKEGYVVTLYFNDYAKQLLINLKEDRDLQGIDCPYVFISKYKGQYNRISNITLNEWCKKAGNMINVPTLHPHDLRHSNATLLKNAGMPLESISKLLQHKGTDVTLQYYIKEDGKKIQAEKDKFDV